MKVRSTLSIGAVMAEADSRFDRGTPSRAEREALLRNLLLARGLERALVVAGHGMPGAGPSHQLTAAVSAASALEHDDRLFLPHHLITAHLTRGMGAEELLAARLGAAPATDASGRLVAGIAPGVAVPLAAGAALALQADQGSRLASAVVEAEWLGDAATARALELARDRALPLVVVAIGSASSAARHVRGAVDRDQPEVVLAAVRAAADSVRAEPGPAVLYCAPLAERTADSEPASEGASGRDALRSYEHWLSSHGFAREELSGLRSAVIAHVQAAGDSLGERMKEAGR
jgi:TPP-dependent pyruvate/acetoin dehydrogenase alpha subunit